MYEKDYIGKKEKIADIWDKYDNISVTALINSNIQNLSEGFYEGIHRAQSS